MSAARPLLMIPGPVELSPAVRACLAAPPPGHLAPELIAAFGSALSRMRRVWLAPPEAQPFVVAGSGTLAMDLAVSNVIEPGDLAVVVNTGFFSDRLAEMVRRAGATPIEVRAAVGDAPEPTAVEAALGAAPGPVKALLATHVDTSTGVRLDPRPLALLARRADALFVLDGVCATGGEALDMAGWDIDVYLTASQKALGLPPGLALLVAGGRALAARAARRAAPPPLGLDWAAWLPVMQAYEERRAAYFATPATSLVLALDVGLGEILEPGLEHRVRAHERAAAAMGAAWDALGLACIPRREALVASTLSALAYPPGVGPELLRAVLARGVTIAGGLHAAIRETYFRVGHMGWVATQPELLVRTARAIGAGLADCGARVDPAAAESAVSAALGASSGC